MAEFGGIWRDSSEKLGAFEDANNNNNIANNINIINKAKGVLN